MLNLAAASFEKAHYKFRRECLAAKSVVAANFADSMDADTKFRVWNRLGPSPLPSSAVLCYLCIPCICKRFFKLLYTL